MKMTDKEKKFLELYRALESKACKEDLIRQASAMVLAQEALKADYELAERDAPMFNGSVLEVTGNRARIARSVKEGGAA
jgi:hypothetical protein